MFDTLGPPPDAILRAPLAGANLMAPERREQHKGGHGPCAINGDWGRRLTERLRVVPSLWQTATIASRSLIFRHVWLTWGF